MDEKDNRYEIYVSCNNCDHQQMVSISKGTTIGKYRRDAICPNCGCKMGGGK